MLHLSAYLLFCIMFQLMTHLIHFLPSWVSSAEAAPKTDKAVSAPAPSEVYKKIKVDVQLKGLNAYFYAGDSVLVSLSVHSFSVLL